MRRKRERLGGAKSAFERQATRLKLDAPFQALPLFIPFLAVVVLSLFTSLELNRKLFSNARPVEGAGTLAEEKEVWLSVGIRNNMVVVATPEGESFSWPISGPNKGELALLESYLSQRARKLVADSVRRGLLDRHQNVAALSVDQSLTYQHVRPIIYALAGAGFSRYGFETRLFR